MTEHAAAAVAAIAGGVVLAAGAAAAIVCWPKHKHEAPHFVAPRPAPPPPPPPRPAPAPKPDNPEDRVFSAIERGGGDVAKGAKGIFKMFAGVDPGDEYANPIEY